VKQLAAAMGGRIDARNADPGAEFRLLLRIAEAGSAAGSARGE